MDVRLARLALDARELLLVRRRASGGSRSRSASAFVGLRTISIVFSSPSRERDALLEELAVALLGALGLDDVIARVDGDALLEERLPHRNAVERDLHARGLLRQEQLQVRDARQELGDARLRGALEILVAAADARAERVLRLGEGVDELARARETRSEMELHVRVVFERERGLVLLDAELRVARLLRLDRFLRELEGARVRPARGCPRPVASGRRARAWARGGRPAPRGTSRRAKRARGSARDRVPSSSPRHPRAAAKHQAVQHYTTTIRRNECASWGQTPCGWWIGRPEAMPRALELRPL